MPRVHKLRVEALERRALLAGDLMSSLFTNAAVDADIGLDQAAIQADAAGGGAIHTGIVDVATSANTDVDATLMLGLDGTVDDVLSLGNSLLGSLQNAVGRTVGAAESTAGNLLGNTGDTTEHLVNNVTGTTDDLVDDLDGTVDDVLGDEGDTANDLAGDLSGVIDNITEDTPLNDLLDDLGGILHVDDLTGSSGLANLPDSLTVDQLHGINGLINSEGRNLNGFLHSLPNKVQHLTNDVAGAVASTGVVDNVFAAIGQTKRGLLH